LSWEETRFESTVRPFRRTAAAVSSHEDSTPKTNILTTLARTGRPLAADDAQPLQGQPVSWIQSQGPGVAGSSTLKKPQGPEILSLEREDICEPKGPVAEKGFGNVKEIKGITVVGQMIVRSA
jgi:hypothetical protein